MKRDNRQRLFEVMGKVNTDFNMAATLKKIRDAENADDEQQKQNILYNKTPENN